MPDIRNLREEALRLAVELFANRPQDDHDEGWAVVKAAGVFTKWLTAPPVAMLVGDPVIASQANPALLIPLNRTGANMAVTMLDTDQATYPAPSETDSAGFPVTTDAITIAESSAGAVVALTVNPDGSATFASVAPGSATVSWTDGTISFSDDITVTPGAAANIVVGPPVVEPKPAPVPPAPTPAP